MVLKRCVYGADKNPMAVELAKVSLWLHTFTVGAPLSFIDHHLAAGDSLFGLWVRDAINKAGKGGELFLHEPLANAQRQAAAMQTIEALNRCRDWRGASQRGNVARCGGADRRAGWLCQLYPCARLAGPEGR